MGSHVSCIPSIKAEGGTLSGACHSTSALCALLCTIGGEAMLLSNDTWYFYLTFFKRLSLFFEKEKEQEGKRERDRENP